MKATLGWKAGFFRGFCCSPRHKLLLCSGCLKAAGADWLHLSSSPLQTVFSEAPPACSWESEQSHPSWPSTGSLKGLGSAFPRWPVPHQPVALALERAKPFWKGWKVIFYLLVSIPIVSSLQRKISEQPKEVRNEALHHARHFQNLVCSREGHTEFS